MRFNNVTVATLTSSCSVSSLWSGNRWYSIQKCLRFSETSQTTWSSSRISRIWPDHATLEPSPSWYMTETLPLEDSWDMSASMVFALSGHKFAPSSPSAMRSIAPLAGQSGHCSTLPALCPEVLFPLRLFPHPQVGTGQPSRRSQELSVQHHPRSILVKQQE